jgi:hypothetical protein
MATGISAVRQVTASSDSACAGLATIAMANKHATALIQDSLFISLSCDFVFEFDQRVVLSVLALTGNCAVAREIRSEE